MSEGSSASNLASRAQSWLRAHSYVVGAAMAVAMGAFAFFPSPVTAAAVALAFVAGALVPELGLAAIALTIMLLPLIHVGRVVNDIRLDEVMAIAAIGGAGLRWLWQRRLPESTLTLPFLVFVVVAVGTMALRVAFGAPVPFVQFAFPFAKQLIRLALFLTVTWVVCRDEAVRERMRRMLVAGGNLGALLALSQAFVSGVTGFLIEHYPALDGGLSRSLYYGRTYGAFDGNPNHLGVAMALIAFLALTAAADAATKRGRWTWFATAVLPLFAVVASGSRAAFVIVLLALVVKAVRSRGVYIWAIVSMLVYTVLAPNPMTARFRHLLFWQNGHVALGSSAAGKVVMFAGGTFHGALYVTDNFYLDMLYNYWPLALIAFLWLVTRIVRSLWHARSQPEAHGGYVEAAWIAVLLMIEFSIQGPFFGAARVVEVFWIILGLAFSTKALAGPVPPLGKWWHRGKSSDAAPIAPGAE